MNVILIIRNQILFSAESNLGSPKQVVIAFFAKEQI